MPITKKNAQPSAESIKTRDRLSRERSLNGLSTNRQLANARINDARQSNSKTELSVLPIDRFL